MHDPRIRRSEVCDNLRCAVGGMVVHHKYIERKIGFLHKHASDRVGNRACPVAHRNYHGCLYRKFSGAYLKWIVFTGSKIRSHGFQMIGAGSLHLYLPIAVGRIDIVEKLASARAAIRDNVSV